MKPFLYGRISFDALQEMVAEIRFLMKRNAKVKDERERERGKEEKRERERERETKMLSLG